MKNLLMISFLFISCTSDSNKVLNNDREPFTPKSAIIIKHSQWMSNEIIPDSTKTSVYPFLAVDPCWVFRSSAYCDSIADKRMEHFVITEMKDALAVLFTREDYNYTPINNDIGGRVDQSSVVSFPFHFTSTRYNGVDSYQMYIDSISNDQAIFIRIDNKPHRIDSGDSCIVSDTIFAQRDSTYCLQKIIVHHTFNNCGIDSLPNQKYLGAFQ